MEIGRIMDIAAILILTLIVSRVALTKMMFPWKVTGGEMITRIIIGLAAFLAILELFIN